MAIETKRNATDTATIAKMTSQKQMLLNINSILNG